MSWADFTAITGFREDYLVSLSDGSLTTLPLLAYQAYEGEQQFTQEVQWASSGSSPLQWMGGLYFLKANAFDGPVNVWAGVPKTEPANAGVLNGRARISSYAGYGQASYELPYGFKLIAGLRTSDEQRTMTTQRCRDRLARSRGARASACRRSMLRRAGPPPNQRPRFNGKIRASCCMRVIRPDSRPVPTTLSAKFPGPLEPEKIKAYEVGGKHDLPFLNHGNLDWAVFYYNYNNIQVAVQDPAVGCTMRPRMLHRSSARVSTWISSYPSSAISRPARH